jgi:hypothetical protein
MLYNRILSISTILMFFFLIFSAVANSAEPRRIGLQDPYTRTVVYCYDNARYSAEDCADYFEKQGYTLLQYLPSKSANYDFLTVDTYPTRRWRNGELTPRW